ncbi:MAG: spore germination protein [Syntrophomonadaceae bacterium]|jgi:hypothetical protein|nr:spore germination protein [Syntrophomonadaceae bacterium]
MRYLPPKGQPEEPLTDAQILTQSLAYDLQTNHTYLEQLLQGCSDAVMRKFKFGKDRDTDALLVYFDGLVSKTEAEASILYPLMLEMDQIEDAVETQAGNIYENTRDRLLAVTDLLECDTFEEVMQHIASGDGVLIIDGYNQGLVAGIRYWQGRPVESPDQEVIVKGPNEGFNETLRINTALLRRRLKTNCFKIESISIGRYTKTNTIICYIKGVADESLIQEVKNRLEKIDIDGVLDTNYLEELMEDHHYSVFPQAEHTERPDRVVAHLLEGRVALMVDGSPWAMVVPATLPQFWISPEDYYSRYVPASLIRLLRQLAFLITLLLPSLYVATITYHQEMIPTPLLLTIAASREGVPFPALVEALMMEITFEFLREAGIRMPRAIGPAISIVGALVIGDAAVSAGLVSTPMVVVVAFTGIASFIFPAYNAGMAIRIARFPMLILAGFLGYFGIMIGLIMLLVRLASMTSFGVPYLSPLAPTNQGDLSDTLVRRPWWAMRQRPQNISPDNRVRQE